jgi:hypothetical protein
MIIRSAVLEGSVAEADQAKFNRYMQDTAMAAIARYPSIREVRLRIPVESEAGAPGIYMIFDLHFDDLDAMHRALASPVRAEVRKALAEMMPLLKGRVYHLIVEEAAVLPGATL